VTANHETIAAACIAAIGQILPAYWSYRAKTHAKEAAKVGEEVKTIITNQCFYPECGHIDGVTPNGNVPGPDKRPVTVL